MHCRPRLAAGTPWRLTTQARWIAGLLSLQDWASSSAPGLHTRNLCVKHPSAQHAADASSLTSSQAWAFGGNEYQQATGEPNEEGPGHDVVTPQPCLQVHALNPAIPGLSLLMLTALSKAALGSTLMQYCMLIGSQLLAGRPSGAGGGWRHALCCAHRRRGGACVL